MNGNIKTLVNFSLFPTMQHFTTSPLCREKSNYFSTFPCSPQCSILPLPHYVGKNQITSQLFLVPHNVSFMKDFPTMQDFNSSPLCRGEPKLLFWIRFPTMQDSRHVQAILHSGEQIKPSLWGKSKREMAAVEFRSTTQWGSSPLRGLYEFM